MTDRDRDDEERLSTDDAVHPEIGTRIGGVPGNSAGADISGGPGGSTGWGAWPAGMGTGDDAPDQPDAETPDEDDRPRQNRIGARHGQIADSGVSTGAVDT